MSSLERGPIQGLCCSIIQLALYNNYHTHNAEQGTHPQGPRISAWWEWHLGPTPRDEFDLCTAFLVMQRTCGRPICHFMSNSIEKREKIPEKLKSDVWQNARNVNEERTPQLSCVSMQLETRLHTTHV